MKPFQVLNQQSKKSGELYCKLLGNRGDHTAGGGAFSLTSIGSALAKAEQFKEKLLDADSNT